MLGEILLSIFPWKRFRQNQHLNNDFSRGYTIAGKKESAQTKVTVITPVYNAENYLRKTIDSVIHQTISMNHIEFILVDDCSTDSSKDILLEYSSKYNNIICVFLHQNTGTPGKPRNIGIQLSQSKYITFLDADDWLEPNGLKILYDILEETGDDYAVGKTIQVHSNGTKIIGEHESCKERRRISPYSIPHIFHHLGPRARMIRARILKENQILFPEMKFAEDKQFFIDVIIHCNTISTTKKTIYYLNRLDNHQTRLSNQTNIMEKSECNLKVIKYIINKKLDVDKEKIILNRLYEYDSITRFFTTPHFQKTKLKIIYYLKLKKIFKTAKDLRYPFSDGFLQPMNKVVYDLFSKRKYRELEKLLKWDRTEKVKDIVITEGLPYIIASFLEDKYKYIRIPMYAVYEDNFLTNDTYFLNFSVYGNYIDSITDVIIVNGKDAFLEVSLPVTVDKLGFGKLEINLELLNQLPSATYSIFIRFNNYMKINIRKPKTNSFTFQYQDRDFIFHHTAYSNIGLKIK